MVRNSLEGPPPLEVEGVSFSYGKQRALSEVSLRLEKGTFTALLGANGAGKTTLLSLITRLFDCREGEIRIAGQGLREAGSGALAHLGIVFQEQTLDLDLTVEQNLRYFAGLRGLPPGLAGQRIDRVLKQLEIDGKRRERVRRLSGGQRRRVEIARSLLHEPPLLILDEPTVGLDIPSRRAMVDEVHTMAHTAGLTILWATHLVDEVRYEDGLVVLDHGCVLADGRAKDVMTSTGTDSVDAAFGALTSGGTAPA